MPDQQNQQPPAEWKNLEVHPIAEVFPRMPAEEYYTLKQDILQRGLQEPILLYENGILDGKARHRACKELDIAPTFISWEGDQSTLAAWLAVKGKNLVRHHLSAERRVAVLLLSSQTFPEVQQTIQAIVGAAEMRQQLGIKLPNQINEPGRGEAADFIGAMVGASGSTVKRVLRVEKEFPQQLKQLAEGKLTCSQILKPTAEPAAFVDGGKKYLLVYADIAKTDGDKMVKALVPRMASKCAVFVWSPPGRLQEALRVLLSCGLAYQTMFVWDKAGGDAELLLLGTVNCNSHLKADKAVIKEKPPKGGGKPELFRELTIYLFPNTEDKRLDLFSPAEVEGWDRLPEAAPVALHP